MKHIEQRIEEFKSTLIDFEPIYGPQMISDFFEYWTESNRSNTKFRQELERTWNLSRRLKTWKTNNDNWNARKPNTERQQRIESIDHLSELSRAILTGNR